MEYPKDKKSLEAILKLHELTLENPDLSEEQVEWLDGEIKKVKAKIDKAK
jgi:hypothetical protein